MATRSVELLDLAQDARVELLELDADAGNVKLEDIEVDRGGHGELVTGAVLITLVSIQALGVLASYLNRHTEHEEVEVESVLRDDDGREKRTTVRWTKKNSQAAEPDQLAALAEMLQVDLAALPTSGV